MQLQNLIVLAVSLLPMTGHAIPARGRPAGAFGGNAAAGATKATATAVSNAAIASAVSAWQADTGIVTNFLNKATTFGATYNQEATKALNAENNELVHKAVLDTALGTNTAVKAANNTLVTQGTFQDVVDVIQAMSTCSIKSAAAQVAQINNNRCVNV
jgi:hypothetical protein